VVALRPPGSRVTAPLGQSPAVGRGNPNVLSAGHVFVAGWPSRMSRAPPKGGGAWATARVTNTRLAGRVRLNGMLEAKVRIRIKGRQSLPELVRKVNEVAEQLGATGVTDVGSVVVRFEPYIGDKRVELRGPAGVPADVAHVNAAGTRVFSIVELRDLRPEGPP
jgi:hypothetical protein